MTPKVPYRDIHQATTRIAEQADGVRRAVREVTASAPWPLCSLLLIYSRIDRITNLEGNQS